MSRLYLSLAALLLSLSVTSVFAQPRPNIGEKNPPPILHIYLSDKDGNKVLLQTQFWLNGLEYDADALRRFFAVKMALEKRGFEKNNDVSIDWKLKERVVRCAISLENLEAGSSVPKSAPAKAGKAEVMQELKSGGSTWCEDIGFGVYPIVPSDRANHVDLLMKRFDANFSGAKKNPKK